MNGFFNKTDINKKLEVGIHIIFYLLSTTLIILIEDPSINLLVSLGGLLLISLMYSRNFLKSVRVTIIVYTLAFCIESIVYVGVRLINEKYFSEYLTSNKEIIVSLVLSKILTYIFALYFIRTKTVKSGFEVAKIPTVILVSFPIFSIIMTITTLFSTQNLFLILMNTILLFVLNIYVFYLYGKLIKDYEEEIKFYKIIERNRMYDMQLTFYQETLKNVSLLQHDIKNQMILVTEYLNTNQSEKALKIINQKYIILDTAEKSLKTDNFSIDSIINYKIYEGKENNVEFNLDVIIPDKIDFPDEDMVSIFGNLLDNAMENVSIQNNKKTVYLKMRYIHNVLIIKISNYFNKKIIYDKKKLKFTSTKADKKNHGIGLENVKSTIEMLDGSIEFEICENIFTVKVQLN